MKVRVVALTLGILCSTVVSAEEMRYDCNRVKEVLDRIENVPELTDVFTFWSGRYIQMCSPNFNKRDYSGPRKRKMRHIG